MKKNYTGIICEYNPFHNGHFFQIKEARKSSDIILCIMSGNTVQRGGFACTDKYSRAKIAVKCGADIVVEHPFPFCMSSAADFATSGVYIANALGMSSLAFGHESDEKILTDIVEILSYENATEIINSIFKNDKKSQNLSYPKAREIYISSILGKNYSTHIKLPNNILSVEYLLNLKKYKTLSPLFIKRNFDFISASQIRDKMYKNEEYSSFVPIKQESEFNSADTDKTILTMLNLSNGYKDIYDCDFSLYNRIISNAKKVNSVDELIKRCTTSAYTSSKIRRVIYSIFFDVETKNVKCIPKYTVLLAANKKGIEYMSENKKSFKIPILTRVSDERKYGLDTELSFKPDRIFSLFSNLSYKPYELPYFHNI